MIIVNVLSKYTVYICMCVVYKIVINKMKMYLYKTKMSESELYNECAANQNYFV